MSFAGGPGHRSPFTERAKATKSHLSPRRSSAQAGTASARGVQQSLFGKESAFGGKEVSHVGDSSAKVSQLRNGAQPDVKEPTTPTRASEGSIAKGNRRDEFSSFNNRRMGTPVKTPRTAFGTIAPRSPKRPYMGSPKYQKVLMERPAFYNSPGGGEPSTESGKKEVSISELQKRLKRFLQDENIPARSPLDACPNNLDEVPYNISRSPRVNPLFHHDDTVLQVAKGGVAFTAGVEEETCTHSKEYAGFNFAKGGVAFTAGVEEETCTHSKENAGFNSAKDGVAFTAGETVPVAEVGARTLSPEATPIAPQSEDERNHEPSEGSETERSLGPEDFPVHSETEDGSQAEEACDEVLVPAVSDEVLLPAVSDEVVVPAVSDAVVVPVVSDEVVVLAAGDDAVPAASDFEGIPAQQSTSAIVEVPIQKATPEIVDEKVEEVNVETKKSIVGVAVENKADSCFEDELEEFEILESWSQRFLKFVVLAVMVACMMGFMVLASSSEGLLPMSLVAGPFSGSFVTPSVIPVSVGFMGLGREHEGMPCLPSVHLGLELLSTPSKNIAPEQESAQLAGGSVHNVVDLDELNTAISYYKELQGRLFSDVASLTESPDSEMAMDGTVIVDGVAVEDVVENEVFEEVAEDISADASAHEDVPEVAAIEEVIPSEDVVSVGDISEVVDEVAEEQFWYSDESEASEKIQIPESSRIILDAAEGPETDVELPAEVESDMLNVESDAVPTIEFVSSETTEALSFNSEPEEATLSVEEPSTEEPFTNDAYPILEEVVVLPIVPSVTEEIATESYAIVSPAEDHVVEPQSDVTTKDAVSIAEHVQTTCPTPVSEMAVPEEPVIEKPVAEHSLLVATIALLAVTLASAVALAVNMRKSPTVAETATEVNLFPGTADTRKSMGSPVAWPSARSVWDSHVPDRDELDAITSPLKGIRAPKRYGMDNLYGSAEPTLSAPVVFKAPSARVVVQKPATTWHPAVNGGSTISSAYRQTASYIPSIPSESGISTSTRGASEIDSVCESALTMGAEEWEHLGSFTTTELVSVVTDGGEEQKVRTPVRRSQRIRNRVSPLPAKFNNFL